MSNCAILHDRRQLRGENHPGDEPRGFLREPIWSSARAARTPLGGADCDAHRRARPLSRSATPVPSLARGPTSKTGLGKEAGTPFVPGTRAYSAHNRLHVNAPTLWRFAQSYIIGGNYVGESPWRTAKIFARTDRALRDSRDSFSGADCDAHRRTRPLSRSATPVPHQRVAQHRKRE